jgi:hypothetical protein
VADAPGESPDAAPIWTVWLERISRLIGSLRFVLGIGVMRASGPPSYSPDSGEPLYSRAIPESVKIDEYYCYEQEISLNPHSEMSAAPAGKIEIRLPYDGDEYFTRQAYADITRIYDQVHGETHAVVGHLALSGYGHTNLDRLLGLSETYGSIPILVPIPPGRGNAGPEYLIADRSVRVISSEYKPDIDWVKVKPIDVKIDLLDPDSSGSHGPAGTAEDITLQVTFRPELLLSMTVYLYVSGTAGDEVPAEVSKVTVAWPTITSLRFLRLKVNGKDHPVRYDPEGRCLEWSKITMAKVPDSMAGGMCAYTSGRMELSIPQPGELYQERSLDGAVEVEVGKLLSGVEARLYSAGGTAQRQPEPELRTHLEAKFNLILDDEFAKRVLRPYQHLHFDEVVPSEMRISDIKIALGNLGFIVDDPHPEDGIEGRWLLAHRYEGPDQMQLDLYVQGIPYQARRDSRLPGGLTYRSNLDSGEIRIYVRGQLPRNSQPVIHEINALRRALRERFDHLPARR